MSETNMDVYSTPTRVATKRRLVDADNTQQDLPDPKRTRVQLDAAQKSNVMDAIIATYIRIAEKLVNDNLLLCRILRNVHLGDQIMNSIYSAHTMKRQEANGYIGNISTHSNKEMTFNYED